MLALGHSWHVESPSPDNGERLCYKELSLDVQEIAQLLRYKTAGISTGRLERRDWMADQGALRV